MSNMNMGTPNHPEGVPHWSAKELVARGIQHSCDASTSRPPRHYASPSLRNVQTIKDAIPNAAVDWNDTWPFWYVAYSEPAHDGCEGGIAFVDLVREIGQRGDIRVEDDWLDFRPDIAIYREDETSPAFVLEVVDTSEPSRRKIDAFKKHGIEAYKLDLKGRGANQGIRPLLKYNPLFVEPLAANRCGQSQRTMVAKVINYWDSLIEQGLRPWVGYYHYPTGVREYGYGGTKPWHDGDTSWKYGDREVVGLQRDDADWGGPDRIIPEGQARTLSKVDWLDCLAYLRIVFQIQLSRGELDDPFMMAIGKYGGEVMSYAYP